MTTVFASGTTLFHLAATHYGDATLWYVIANANNISDPWLGGVLQIIIPSMPTANGASVGRI